MDAKPAPPAPAAFQAELERLVAAYGEPVGIAVTDVTDGWTAQVAGQEEFPQQSVSKLWVALAVLKAVDEGALHLDQWVVMRKEDRSVFLPAARLAHPRAGRPGHHAFRPAAPRPDRERQRRQ